MPPHMYLAGVEMGKGAKFTTNEISGRSVNCLQNYSSVLKSKLYTILKINFFFYQSRGSFLVLLCDAKRS